MKLRKQSRLAGGGALSADFWLLAVPLAAVPFAVTALVFHQISILGEQGISPGIAAGIFIVFALASAAATSLSGFLTERLGPRKPLGISLGLLLLGVIGLQVASTPLLAAGYAAVVGAAAGIQGVVAGTIWAHYYGTSRARPGTGTGDDGHDLRGGPRPLAPRRPASTLRRLLSGPFFNGRYPHPLRRHALLLRPQTRPP